MSNASSALSLSTISTYDKLTTPVGSLSSGNRAMDFLVRKGELERIKFSIRFDPEYRTLAPGDVLFALRTFGLSRTNVTYARHGESAGFWRLFPSERGWGSLPCWGIADVVRSRNEHVAEGESFYGCFPVAMRSVVRLSARRDGMVERATPRLDLPPAFGRYQRVADLACTTAQREATHILFRPAFETAVLIRDFLRSRGLLDVEAIVIAGAESKTARCLAHLLAKAKAFVLFGLTSRTRRGGVQRQDAFDAILGEEDLRRIPGDRATVIVDLSDQPAFATRLQRHLGGNLRAVCRFGYGHAPEHGSDEPSAKIEISMATLLVTAPTQPDPEDEAVWTAFAADALTCGELRHRTGYRAVAQIYLDALAGRSNPASHVLSW